MTLFLTIAVDEKLYDLYTHESFPHDCEQFNIVKCLVHLQMNNISKAQSLITRFIFTNKSTIVR